MTLQLSPEGSIAKGLVKRQSSATLILAQSTDPGLTSHDGATVRKAVKVGWNTGKGTAQSRLLITMGWIVSGQQQRNRPAMNTLVESPASGANGRIGRLARNLVGEVLVPAIEPAQSRHMVVFLAKVQTGEPYSVIFTIAQSRASGQNGNSGVFAAAGVMGEDSRVRATALNRFLSLVAHHVPVSHPKEEFVIQRSAQRMVDGPTGVHSVLVVRRVDGVQWRELGYAQNLILLEHALAVVPKFDPAISVTVTIVISEGRASDIRKVASWKNVLSSSLGKHTTLILTSK